MTTTISWIEPWGQLAWLRQCDDAIARVCFDTPSSHVVGGPVPGYQVTATRLFTAFDTYAQTNPAYGGWVIYDLENWAQSPAVDKNDPAAAYSHFLSLAKARGHGLIATPGRDLVYAQGGPQGGESLNDAYLRLGIPAACAGAPIMLVQSQGSQKDLAAFTSLISGAMAQRVDPNQAVWFGLTTAAGTTVKQLSDAYSAALALGVSGCWLTIGAQGQAQTAADFLHWTTT